MPTPWMPPCPGASARTAATHSATSAGVRGSAKSRFWMPEPMARTPRYVRGCCSIFIMAERCGKVSTARARFSRAKQIVGRVLSGELHVVEEAGVSHQLDGGGPCGVDVGAEGGLARPQELAEPIGTHAFDLLPQPARERAAAAPP